MLEKVRGTRDIYSWSEFYQQKSLQYTSRQRHGQITATFVRARAA